MSESVQTAVNGPGFSLPNLDSRSPVPVRDQALAIRGEFLDRLVEVDLVEQAYLDKPSTQVLVDAFSIDGRTGRDALLHTLIGDSGGGLHHLRSVMDAEVEYRGAGSHLLVPAHRTHDGRQPDVRSFHRRQSVQDNGVFSPEYIVLPGHNGQSSIKPEGSSMFPSDWSVQDILDAVRTTVVAPDSESQRVNRYNRVSYRLDKKVGEVTVRVVMPGTRNRILSAYPTRPTMAQQPIRRSS